MIGATPPRLVRGLLGGSLAAILVAACGCGSPDMAAVTGTVKYEDGSPVTGGEVILHPTDDPNLTSPLGYIQPNGTFALFTSRPGDGVRIGRYKVAVTPPTDDYGPKNPLPIDTKFANPNTSGIEFEVKPGSNTLDITVHRPRK
jgi:hypothetical protein